MIVYVFGNPDLDADSLPLRIVPKLRERFPDIRFEVKDPNEEWDVPEELTVIDSVEGIDGVRVFENLDQFTSAPHVTMHDFDAFANLRLLQKLGKLKKIKIIGTPVSRQGASPTLLEKSVFIEVSAALRTA